MLTPTTTRSRAAPLRRAPPRRPSPPRRALRPGRAAACSCRARRRSAAAASTRVVESHPVHHRAMSRQPEHPGPRITRLRLRRHRAHLDEREPERGERGHAAGVLVEPGGQPQGARAGRARAPGHGARNPAGPASGAAASSRRAAPPPCGSARTPPGARPPQEDAAAAPGTAPHTRSPWWHPAPSATLAAPRFRTPGGPGDMQGVDQPGERAVHRLGQAKAARRL